MSQVPSLGRIVHYCLTLEDVDAITARRYALAKFNGLEMGGDLAAGNVYAATIVQPWGNAPDSLVNLQVHLDGFDTYWARSVKVNDGPIATPGTFMWPQRT